MTSKNSLIKFSTPKKATRELRDECMPWLFVSSPIPKPARVDSPTVPDTSRKDNFSIEMEIVSSDEDVFVQRPATIKKSSNGLKKFVDRSRRDFDRFLSTVPIIENDQEEIISGIRTKRGKNKSTVVNRASASDICLREIASNLQMGIESSGSDVMKPAVDKQEKKAPERNKRPNVKTRISETQARKKFKQTEQCSNMPINQSSHDKEKASTPIVQSAAAAKNAAAPRRKSSPRAFSKTNSVAVNSSMDVKRRHLDLVAISVDSVKRKIDFASNKPESEVRRSAGSEKDIVIQRRSVTFSMAPDTILNASAAKNQSVELTATANNAGLSKVVKKNGRGTQSPNTNEVEVRTSKRQRRQTPAIWLGCVIDDSTVKSSRISNRLQPEQIPDKEKPCRPLKTKVQVPAIQKKKKLAKIIVKQKKDLNNQPVCFAALSEATFAQCGDGDTSGVVRATTMFLHDMEAQFIRLPPGGETGDLSSHQHNQFYTVLENKVLLDVGGMLKNFDLHDQFHVCKGLPHRIVNKSKLKSFVQCVEILV